MTQRERPARTLSDRAFDALWYAWCRETGRDVDARADLAALRRFFDWWQSALADVAS